jgi:uncharacterized protein (DUF4213/DUF364 family)
MNKMILLDKLIDGLLDGDVVEVRVGLHWTAVAVDVEEEMRCGLASTLSGEHRHGGEPDVPMAGRLEELSAQELASLARSQKPVLASLGVAAMNALMPRTPEAWVDGNAEEILSDHGAGKRVAIIGHFPFVPRLRERVGELIVLERNPGQGDLPAEAAPDVLPNADVIAITGMTLANHTLDSLLNLCSQEAVVMVLGPSTPLSPVLFDFGVDLISGAVVTRIEPVLRAVAQGANFRQVHKAGVRLVTMVRPGFAFNGNETG